VLVPQSLVTDAAEMARLLGKEGSDPYGELRSWVRKQLKGDEQTAIVLLCNENGSCALKDLALKLGWSEPIKSAWDGLRRRLNPKLKRQKPSYRLSCRNKRACLTAIGRSV
jgi:hypothetical protein